MANVTLLWEPRRVDPAELHYIGESECIAPGLFYRINSLWSPSVLAISRFILESLPLIEDQ